jgi:hypothetical protein
MEDPGFNYYKSTGLVNEVRLLAKGAGGHAETDWF